MPVKSEDYNNICVMNVNGDFVGGENAQQARKLVEDSIDQRQIIDFIVDFEKVPFVDSEGLETLLWMKRRCEDMFGKIKLINLDENCRKILEITRLDHRFECHADLEAAMKTMR